MFKALMTFLSLTLDIVASVITKIVKYTVACVLLIIVFFSGFALLLINILR